MAANRQECPDIVTPPRFTSPEELRLVSTMVREPRHIDDIAKLVRPTDFGDSALRAAYESIVKRRHEAGGDGQALATLVLGDLRDHPTADGGRMLLDDLNLVATAADVATLAAAVRDAALKRRIHDAASTALQAAANGHSGEEVLADLFLFAEDELRGAERGDGVKFQRISCAELDRGDYELEFLIDNMLVKGQPGILAGPPKGLKTGAAADMSISLTTATRFFGRFDVPRVVRTAFMSGESGLSVLQETARRISAARGLNLADNSNLIWSPDLPRFGNVEHADALRAFLEEDAIEVLIVDPAYLCLPGADAGNLMIQGEMLRAMSRLCDEIGVTLLIVHHTKRNTLTPSGEPLELSDIAWAGFPEFARQWWLINRRERYEEGTGEHRLWLSVGGSAGHSGLYAVDVSEGVWNPTEPRYWDVSIQSGNALLAEQRQAKRDEKSREREEKAEEKRDADRTKVWAAMCELGRPETTSIIAGAAQLNNARTKAAIGLLMTNKLVREAKVVRANNQSYPGFELTEEGRGNASEAA
ncbi:AAA family ATPase [Botrimarina sp.]|uniref:AAA family ATPase n=1 Tax=Botrimarina sp. TaxID=2795802 RepID=UPI0032EACCEC